MRTGLVHSLNVVTVDVATRTGLERVAQLAESFGLPRPEAYPALALGTTEVTPLKMAAAYTAFANNGQRVEPRVIAHATNADGEEVFGEIRQGRQVVKPTTAYMITDSSQRIDTARNARRAAQLKDGHRGKTGTNVMVGSWATRRNGCAVWIGFDDNKQLGLTGAEAALPAWTDFVKSAVELRPELGGEAFDRPAGITTIEIDPETGLRSTPSCPQRERIAVASNFVTTAECYKHTEMYELMASADEEQFDDETTTVDTADAVEHTRARAKEASHRRPPPLPRALTSKEIIESLPGATRVETSAQGRRTLPTRCA